MHSEGVPYKLLRGEVETCLQLGRMGSIGARASKARASQISDNYSPREVPSALRARTKSEAKRPELIPAGILVANFLLVDG